MVDNYSQPFIGKQLLVRASANTDVVGIRGLVVDETKYSFLLSVNGIEKRILKSKTIFVCDEQIIDGDKLIKRLDERIKLRGK